MTTPTTEQEAYYERTRRPLVTVPKSRFGRVVFGLGIVVWFLVLMLPCALFYIAATGTIRIGLSGAVEAERHPLLEVNLLMSVEQRGFQITRSVIQSNTSTAQCLETYVSYVLWQTDGTAENVAYCDCYQRADSEAAWELSGTNADLCETES